MCDAATSYSGGGSFEESKDVRNWVMALTIVWRNPVPLVRFQRTLQRILSNELGAVYAVTAPDLTQKFEVIPGEVAW
jgi:hypothetical protein